MDFVSIRKKARERAEARARLQAEERPASAPAPGDPPSPPPPPAPPEAILSGLPAGLLADLRGELEALARRVAPELAADLPEAMAAPESPPGARDPLDEFFWREDEEAPALPDLGLGAGRRRGEAAAMEERKEFVTFLLGSEEYAVAIERVREILKPPPIAEVPRSPAHVLGVVTVRGEVIPVVDPRPRLALPPAAAGRAARVLLCEAADGPTGLLVDAVSHVLRLAPSAIEARPPGLGGAGTEAIAGIGRERDRLVVLLDLDALLPAAGGSP